MSKVLEVTCEAGVITYTDPTIGDIVIEDVEILSLGEGESQGLLIIDGEKKYYITTSSNDLKQTLEKTADALQVIASTLTDIGTGMTGSSTAPPPSLPGNVTQINNIVTELDQLGGNLS